MEASVLCSMSFVLVLVFVVVCVIVAIGYMRCLLLLFLLLLLFYWRRNDERCTILSLEFTRTIAQTLSMSKRRSNFGRSRMRYSYKVFQKPLHAWFIILDLTKERNVLAAAAICELSLFGNMSYDKISTIISFEVLLHVPDRLAPYNLRGVIKRHGTTGHLYAVVH